MPGNHKPDLLHLLDLDEHNGLRKLSRSPHPYHHQNFELPYPADRLVYPVPSTASFESEDHHEQSSPFPAFPKDSSPTTDSGTDADDEHFLKGLPAPKARLHKGLRGHNEPLSGTSTPLPSPENLDEGGRKGVRKSKIAKHLPEKLRDPDNYRRAKVIVRRSLECSIIASLGLMVWMNPQVRLSIRTWSRELLGFIALIVLLLLLYVPRLVLWTYQHRTLSTRLPVAFPVSCDPAPILYPPSITLFVASIISIDNLGVILPNIILSICSIPPALIPSANSYESFNPLHWLLSCLPLLYTGARRVSLDEPSVDGISTQNSRHITPDTAILLYPLHQSLCGVLHYLTTTSLEPAELQLLSIALINVLLLSSSPQMQLLKALLWVGGLGVMVLCGQVIRQGIALARVPKWRFRRLPPQREPSSLFGSSARLLSFSRSKREMLWPLAAEDTASETLASDDEVDAHSQKRIPRFRTFGLDENATIGGDLDPVSPVSVGDESASGLSAGRRSTFPNADKPSIRRLKTHTRSGRRKRATSMTVRAFFRLTQAEAASRKWIYATYVYACILAVVFIGIRGYIGRWALGGNEAIGWALGYLFGDLPWFRFNVVSHNLERWICLPPHRGSDRLASCHQGWVQHIRDADFGEANTRLILAAYWLMILIFGLIVVVRLDEKYEVDTRRKVFHFMMVAMFLPGTFVDPTFAAMALSFVLATFLILDLLRASQLPPLSKPLAAFLAPYVDGRDFRGPVVISHIFLLVGCAVPLWLSLASLPRTGSNYLVGWEVPTREVSMVSGVVCVGLGDSAASLIGRRYGHRKWFWGGGKSLEGSLAFAVAVIAGLFAANTWLKIGGWPVSGKEVPLGTSLRNTGVCASMASLTEAVLTGGNDNVIVPVVLWTCVKSLGL